MDLGPEPIIEALVCNVIDLSLCVFEDVLVVWAYCFGNVSQLYNMLQTYYVFLVLITNTSGYIHAQVTCNIHSLHDAT